MSANLTYNPSTQIAELHIRGILKRSDMAEVENEIARRIDAGEHPRALVLEG